MTKLDPLTAAEIEAAEKLCEAATPGPWRWNEDAEDRDLAEKQRRLLNDRHKRLIAEGEANGGLP